VEKSITPVKDPTPKKESLFNYTARLRALEKKIALNNYISDYKRNIGGHDDRKVSFPE
jgi:hypothetical protein